MSPSPLGGRAVAGSDPVSRDALETTGGSGGTEFPDAAFDAGGVGLFSTLEIVETVEVSLYLPGFNAFVRDGEEFGARLCAEAMGTEAVHRALVRFAQNELGKDVGVPNDVGFENFGWPNLPAVRLELEGLGIGSGTESDQPGRF
jgi:hypothetical protein